MGKETSELARMNIGVRQRRHFNAMSRAELKAVIQDAYKQMDVIAFSGTKAGKYKRDELQARIDYCTQLLSNGAK